MLLKHLKLCTYKLCLVPEINIIIIITIVHTYTYTYTVIHSKKKIVVLIKGNAQKHLYKNNCPNPANCYHPPPPPLSSFHPAQVWRE